ncbi:hypothetical protein OAI84_00610, partial [bacterium]|nr:hypothetical protein [bacterium]
MPIKINYITFQKEPEYHMYISENSLLSSEEKEFLEKNNISTSNISESIYYDDTIDTIKRKIMLSITKASFGELYLFGIQEKEINSNLLYKELTQNGKTPLTKDSLYQYLQNFIDINIEQLPVKEVYELQDLLILKLDKKKHKIKVSIGQQFIIDQRYHYTINPFDTILFEETLSTYPEEIITTKNSSLLFDVGKLVNDTIYLCTIDDVLKFADSISLNHELFIRIYFPYLFQHNIKNMKEYKSKRIELREKNKDLLTKSFKNRNKNVDFFYNIYFDRTEELKYKKRGIKSIQFVIHPKQKIQIPLETIFKLIHATQQIPFIKYNPGVHQENVYRLYSDNVAKNGKKIPYLPKSQIMKLRKKMAKHKQVALFIITRYNEQLIEIECSFEKNGDIHILLEEMVEIKVAEEIIRKGVNPVLTVIGNFLGQSGYMYVSFSTFNEYNIRIKNISYIVSIEISNDIKIDPWKGCISSIFNIIENKEKIIFRYKRTSNFNEMNSQDAYITEMFQKDMRQDDIVIGLQQNFSMSNIKAKEKIKKWLTELDVELTLHENRRLKIKNNPGFPVFIQKELYSKNVKIQIDNINNIFYLESIPIFIDSLIRLTQNMLPISQTEHCKEKIQEIKPVEEIQEDKIDVIEFGNEGNDFGFSYNEEDEGDDGDGGDFEEGDFEEGDFEFGNNIQFGGGDIDVTGMSLTNPSPFMKKMEERDPILFLKKQKGKYSSYSRICPSNIRRQPVLIDEEEKKYIDKHHKGSYTDAIKYGSSPDKQHYYICPRYWCLTKNVSLTEKQVRDGVCGGKEAIIPKDAKKVEKGKQIYEFNSYIHVDKDGTYKNMGPGLIPNRHPDEKRGLCIPCCFKNWKSNAMKKKIKQCIQKNKQESITDLDDYIKSAEKFPLNKQRWGILPLNVQKFLQFDNNKCFSNKKNRVLKENYMCFLRYGVENNSKQSFVACMADVFAKINQIRRTPTIKEMKTLIIKSLDLKTFKSLNDGYLIQSFGTYQRFKEYLKDDDIDIDYQYLWDIITLPNKQLFPQGLNLVILNIPEEDITDNLELICPYRYIFYKEIPTIILLKKGQYYEPIYGYQVERDTIVITPIFMLKDDMLPSSIKKSLLFIERMFLNCKPERSLIKRYLFEDNLKLNEMVPYLEKIKYTIKKQVVNYHHQVIGLIVINHNIEEGFLPIKPSTLNNKMEYIVMDDSSLWKGYNKTLNFLKDIYMFSKKKIPCLPKFKVEEDGLIVGFLTMTNQFVMIDPPQENIPDEIEVIKGYNYIQLDKMVAQSEKKDVDREIITKKIKLESHFFNIFRNTVRILLQEYKYKKVRDLIERTIETSVEYDKKLEIIIELLRKMLEKHVDFVQFSTKVLKNIGIITSCLKMNKADCKEKSYCLGDSSKYCKLLIPDKHLISEHDNRVIYLGRMADELVRYGR